MSSYLFIDGAYLLRQFTDKMTRFYGVAPLIRFDELAAGLVRPFRTMFYDAVDHAQRKDETPEQLQERVHERMEMHRYINSLSGFHVRTGYVRRSKERKGEPREQKAVDVLLSVDALEHAANRNMKTAALIAGDLDFEPLASALVRLGVRVEVYYVNGHAADELLDAADHRQALTIQDFYRWSSRSFQQCYRPVTFHVNVPKPGQDGRKNSKYGKFQRRQVILMDMGSDQNHLYVEAGDELSEPSVLLTHNDVSKLPVAFEMTYGKIDWNKD